MTDPKRAVIRHERTTCDDAGLSWEVGLRFDLGTPAPLPPAHEFTLTAFGLPDPVQ